MAVDYTFPVHKVVKLYLLQCANTKSSGSEEGSESWITNPSNVQFVEERHRIPTNKSESAKKAAELCNWFDWLNRFQMKSQTCGMEGGSFWRVLIQSGSMNCFFFTGRQHWWRPMSYLFRFQSECHQCVKLSFLSYFLALPPPSHLFAFTTSILLPSDSTSRLHFSSLLPPTIKTRCIAQLLLVPLHRSASLFHEISKQLRKMLVVNLQGSLL